MINFLLWLPFLLTAIIAGIIFCITGYKKGLFRSLISLGVTFVSAVLSMLLANLTAPVLVPAISGLIPEIDTANDIVPPEMIQTLINGVIQDFISLMLFSVLFFVLTIVLKLVYNAIKHRDVFTEKKATRYGGAGVRFVDAILYALLLLLPLYGSISTYAPVASSVAPVIFSDESEESSSELSDALYTAEHHPVVVMSNASPAKLFYNGLSGFRFNGATIDIPQIMNTIGKTITMAKDLIGKDIRDYGDEELELIAHLRENVVDSEWFYALSSGLMTSVKDSLTADPEDSALNKELIDMLQDMSKEDFKANCTVLLDVSDFAIRNGVISSIAEDDVDLDELYKAGFFDEMSKAVNHSPQLAAMKTLMINSAVSELSEEYPEFCGKLNNSLTAGQLTSDEDIKAEAEAFAVLSNADGNAVIFDFIMRHPMFSDDAKKLMLDEIPISNALDLSFMDSSFEIGEAREQALAEKLYETASLPADQPIFSDYCNASSKVLYMFAKSNRYSTEWYMEMFEKGGTPVLFAIDFWGEDYLLSLSDFAGRRDILDTLKRTARQADKAEPSR